jgi:hypothetical protein
MNDDEIRKNWGDFVTGNPSTLQDKPASNWGAASFRCKTIQSLHGPVKERINTDTGWVEAEVEIVVEGGGGGRGGGQYNLLGSLETFSF